MFVKYNGVLRGLGSGVPFLQARMTELCMGNRYTTSICAINSALVKLSKLTRVCKVYRGLSGSLPSQFWQPNAHGVCGGVEAAFLSATPDLDVAMAYASGAASGGVLFEMQMGMTSRGADLSWISQYPEEKEFCFAPLLGLSVISTRVQGAILVVELGLAVNHNAMTLEQAVSGMQRSHTMLLSLTQSALADVAPKGALGALRGLAEDAELQDPLWYNVPSNYRQSTERAFRVQEDTFRALGEADTWALETESSQQISERQLKVASSLAFAGDAANAIAVLRLALARVPLSAEQRERVSTAIAAHANGALLERSGDAWRLHVIAMLLDGTEGNELREPWPVVAVSVVESCADDATKRATADAIAALLAPPANKPGRFARKQRVLVLQKRIIDQDSLYVEKAWYPATVADDLPSEPNTLCVSLGGRMLTIGQSECASVAESGRGALLLAAAHRGSEALVGALLDAGEPVWVVDRRANSPLHFASRAGYAAIVRRLLDAGASAGTYNMDRQSSTELANIGGHAIIADLFRAQVTSRGELAQAAMDGDLSTVQRLALETDPESVRRADPGGEWPLALASRFGHDAVVRVLLQAGAEVNALGVDGTSALFAAAETGQTACITLLLTHWADVHLTEHPKAKTPFLHACHSGHVDAARLLLGSSASLDGHTITGWRPLMFAAGNGLTELTRFLIDTKAQLDARGPGGGTALHLASKNNFLADARELLLAGADANLRRSEGDLPPLMLAAANGNAGVCACLLQHGAERDAELDDGTNAAMRACECAMAGPARTLFRLGVDPDARRSSDQRTALMLAAQSGDVDCVLACLSFGAQLLLKDGSGKTALQIARLAGERAKEAVDILEAEEQEQQYISA